ncbi:MAG: esterase-like activity of phytase family protein, partial [Candidatus Binatia bacterium]
AASPACTHDDVARSLVLTNHPARFSRTDAAATTQGKLRFRGGVRLTSADDDFGGLSSILVSADGTLFVAVSDEAHWVTGSLEYEDGNLVRAVGGMIAPLRDLNGLALASKAGDAEGLASTSGNDTGGDLLVSFEGNHRVWRYPFAKDGIRAVPVNVPTPPEVHGAPYNGGIEGLTLLADNMFVGITERYRNAIGDYRGWILWLEAP